MALTERTRPYETLIRHNPDGSIGAYHKQITEVLRNGVVIPGAVEGDPIPLAVADGQAGLKLSEVLGEAASLALLRVEAVQAEKTQMELTLQQMQGELAQAQATIEAQRQELERLSSNTLMRETSAVSE